MEIYDVKTRTKVQVAEKDLKKKKFERQTSKGTQYRYAVIAEVNGSKLQKFINEATYNSLNVPEA